MKLKIEVTPKGETNEGTVNLVQQAVNLATVLIINEKGQQNAVEFDTPFGKVSIESGE